MVVAKRYSLEDIIAEEVAKQTRASAPAAGGGDLFSNFGIKDIGDITKLLKEINALTQVMQGNRQEDRPRIMKADVVREGSSVNKERGEVGASVPLLQPATEAQENAKTAISLDVPRLVDNFIQYIPMVIATYGDLKLSEVVPVLEENKEQIISALEGLMK
jgi:hypothetical protein